MENKKINYVEKIVFGKPIDTMAVVEDILQTNKVRYFDVKESDNAVQFLYNLSEKDIVYGLGENMGGINKRGRRYVSFNTDDPNHRPEMEKLYSSHNFLIVDGKDKFGAFFDTPSKVTFDIDVNGSGEILVTCDNQSLNLYIIDGKSAYDIAKKFLKIIGKSFVPPLWAFGFGQSRWGYCVAEDFEKVAEGYRKNHLPLDYICMDIDYIDRYIDFTIDEKKFPDMKNFVEKFKQNNINLVPIVDAGIKIEPGNKTYDEGVKNDYFCKDKDGKYFEALVWPGLTHFVDFFNPDARKWFGRQYKNLISYGFEGFWNDMNEPSIFLNAFVAEKGKNSQKAEDKQKTEDYKRFYHKIDGKMVNHYDVHNVYGHLMTVAAGSELKKMLKNRYLLFTRSTYVGTHRYGGIWTGDNASEWWQLKQNVLQMPSLNMCGLLYSGADTGGFKKDCSTELMLRWLAFSVFTPLMRNHCGRSSKPQECYNLGHIDDFRSILGLRYRMLAYLYSEFMKAQMQQDMFIKPLAFIFDDEISKSIEDQLIVGESVMIAPILEEGKNTRMVYLPEDMTKVLYDGKTFSCQPANKGWQEIKAELNEVVFFILNNKLVPVGKFAESTKEVDLSDVELIGDGVEYKQYIDDGKTKRISKNNIRILKK